MNNSTVHYPVIVATPNDALKYSEAFHKIEQSNKAKKKKKALERIKRFIRKILKKEQKEKIEVDDQYCFSLINEDSPSNSSFVTDDVVYDMSRIVPPSPALYQSSQQQEVVNTDLNKRNSKASFFKKLKGRKASKKAKKGKKDSYQSSKFQYFGNNNEILSPSVASSVTNSVATSKATPMVAPLATPMTSSMATPNMRELTLYENSTTSAMASPFINNNSYCVPPSANSSFYEMPSTTFSPAIPHTPYMHNLMKNGQTSMLYINPKDDMSFSTRREYASSIYSDESTHLPDDDDNIIDDVEEEEIKPPSCSEATMIDEKENKSEKEKNKNIRYNGHFEEDSEDESKNSLQPIPRPFTTMKKVWDNPFGRISYIEYTIDKQKELEKNKKNKNLTHYNIVTKPPLNNNMVKNTKPMIVSKRSVSSLTASLSKTRQEELHNAAIKARENSSLALSSLAASHTSSQSTKDNKDQSPDTTTTANQSQILTKSTNKNSWDNEETANTNTINTARNSKHSRHSKSDSYFSDKRASAYSITNLIKYSDLCNDSTDSSFSSTNADSHYSQVLSHYKKYKNRKSGDNQSINSSHAVVGTKEDETTEYDSSILNFTVPGNEEEGGDQQGKEIKLSLKKSNTGSDNKSINRKAIITEISKDTEETTENDKVKKEDSEENTNKEETIEYNRYLPGVPSANYLLNNQSLTRSRVLNINDNSFNVLKHANTLKANRKSIIEAELKAKKEEEEKEKQREEARKEREKRREEARKEREKRREEARKERERQRQAKKEAEGQEGQEGQGNPESQENSEGQEDKDSQSIISLEDDPEEEEEEEEPRKPEDHYREYYEKEVIKPVEEESIDALFSSKDKDKNKDLNDMMKKVFTGNGENSNGSSSQDHGSIDKDKTKTEIVGENKSIKLTESPLNEAVSIKSKSSNKNVNKIGSSSSKGSGVGSAKSAASRTKEVKKEESNQNNGSTISNRFFNFIKSSSKYLYNDEKGEKGKGKEKVEEKEKEKEKVKEEEKEKGKEEIIEDKKNIEKVNEEIKNREEKVNDEMKNKEEKVNDEIKNKKEKVNEEKTKNKEKGKGGEEKEFHVVKISPVGSPIKPKIHPGPTKLVRSASLSLAKRHNRQIKESKTRSRMNLERNNSSCTNVERTNSTSTNLERNNSSCTNVERTNSNCTNVERNNTTYTTDSNAMSVEDNDSPNKTMDHIDSANITITISSEDETDTEMEQTFVIEKREHNLENEKTPTLTYRTGNEIRYEKPILTDHGTLFSEPETEVTNFTDNIANKIHNLQNEIIIEEEEDKDEEEDILIKIQNEMNKKFAREFDDHKNNEISDNFSISSGSTFSSDI